MGLLDLSTLYRLSFGTAGDLMPVGGPVGPNGRAIRCPVKMAVNGRAYQLPFEPLVSVFGRNTVIRNNVLKGRGKSTVKEYWSSDDYTIEIRGIIIGSDNRRLPSEDLENLRYMCEARKAIEVSSPLLSMFGIQFMAIESFDFAHTPGYNNQTYQIRAYSDEPFELF